MNRKSIYLVLLVLLVSLTSYSQKPILPKIKSGISLNGKVIEKGTNKPVEFVTVKLIVKKDSTFIAGCITDAAGSFSLKNVAINDYFIEYSSIGFKPSRSQPFNVTTARGNLNLGTLELSTES